MRRISTTLTALVLATQASAATYNEIGDASSPGLRLAFAPILV